VLGALSRGAGGSGGGGGGGGNGGGVGTTKAAAMAFVMTDARAVISRTLAAPRCFLLAPSATAGTINTEIVRCPQSMTGDALERACEELTVLYVVLICLVSRTEVLGRLIGSPSCLAGSLQCCYCHGYESSIILK
jgi:hypothetical protein